MATATAPKAIVSAQIDADQRAELFHRLFILFGELKQHAGIVDLRLEFFLPSDLFLDATSLLQ